MTKTTFKASSTPSTPGNNELAAQKARQDGFAVGNAGRSRTWQGLQGGPLGAAYDLGYFLGRASFEARMEVLEAEDAAGMAEARLDAALERLEIARHRLEASDRYEPGE